MLVTEKEASEKWCPHVRIARDESIRGGDYGPLVGGCNTDALGGVRVPSSCRCIGSRCMAWRWGPRPTPRFYTYSAPDSFAQTEPSRPSIVPDSWEFEPFDGTNGARWVEPDYDVESRWPGFCGLAGRAEVAA